MLIRLARIAGQYCIRHHSLSKVWLTIRCVTTRQDTIYRPLSDSSWAQSWHKTRYMCLATTPVYEVSAGFAWQQPELTHPASPCPCLGWPARTYQSLGYTLGWVNIIEMWYFNGANIIVEDKLKPNQHRIESKFHHL